jgi:protein-S-isoprenylcysteine O-methyltransferase Ste14
MQTWFGSIASRWYRFAYNVFAGVTLLPVLATPAMLPDQRLYTISPPWIAFSIAGQILAVVGLAAGLLQTGIWSFLGLRQIVANQTEPPELFVRGLYRYVRHPLYTAGLVFIWLTPVMTLNLLALNVGLSAYIIMGAKFEERKLRREFGQAYAEYQAKVPMLLPNPLRKYS